ncbi:MAG: PrsW family intramembrane metalloprotease [Chloroflexi bacterium]|nr:PrsW family intramembrane metalloprotease [Chloroflexota bacterium]
MPFLVSIFFGFAPMLLFAAILYWLDRYEKEPKLLLGGVFLWGAIVAAGGAFIINTVLGIGIFAVTNDTFATDLATGSIVAPLVEEILKGLAVLGVFLVFRKEFDSIFDGILYAGVAAMGFAATENVYYIYNHGFLESGWEGLWFLVFVRVALVGWQHPFYTAFFGIGLAVARLSRSGFIKALAPLAGLSFAMFAHGIHNTLASILPGLGGLAAGTLLDWTGWFFMFLFILWAVWREQKYLRLHLWEEVQSGAMTQAHYRTATSAWLASFARLAAFFNGRFKATRRFYQVCAELAHKKEQRIKVGEEEENSAIIARYRAELAQLAPGVQV